MKKSYIVPTTIKVEIKVNSLLVQYSNSEAAVGAKSLSREGNRNSSWDDDEDE